MAQAAEMEHLVRELNDPRNQSLPETIDTIQRRIQSLQHEPIAWKWGIDLLNHNDAVMRFYGSLTLTIKVNTHWDADQFGEDRDRVNTLLEELVSNYVRLSSVPDVPFVLQKLCTTLVAFFQKPQSAWALPIRHLMACTIANQYIPQSGVPEMAALLSSGGSIHGAQLRYLLMFPMTLAEQEGAVAGTAKEQIIRVRTSNNISDILRLLHFTVSSLTVIDTGSVESSSIPYDVTVICSETQHLDLTRTMLQLLPLWTKDIKVKSSQNETSIRDSIYDLFVAIVATFSHLFQQEPLCSAVLHSLTALEESSHSLLRKALPDYELGIIQSPQAAAWVEQLMSGDFDPDAVAYVSFLEACMNQVDVTSPKYLGTGFYIELLKQVRSLLHCEGAPGVDDTVCQVALEILTSVTEGFNDWDGPTPYDDSMKELIKSACGGCMDKIRIPLEELTVKSQTWDADDRAKFQDFRYDVQDYLQNAFGVLGDSLIKEVIKTTVDANPHTQWNLFEAGLFSLTAFSDTFGNEAEHYDQYIGALFGCETWHAAVQVEIEVPDRVRQMVIKVIGENTGFLQRHTLSLIPSLNFLFTSLQLESSATAASRAIYTLCDAQRSILTEALPQFLHSLHQTSDIESDARNRIYAGVGAIIQALPAESDKVQPLALILRRLQQNEVEAEVDPTTTSADLHTRAADILQTVAALGKGLRAPADTPLDQENSGNESKEFWTSGSGSVVQHQILHIHNTLLEQSHGQEYPSFVEAACNLLKTGFTEEHPSPFKFSNEKTVELLTFYMQPPCPRPDHVMSAASAYLASARRSDPTNQFEHLIMASINLLNNAFVAHKASSQTLNTDFTTATLEFYTRLLPKWSQHLFSLPQSSEIVSLIIEIALILHADNDTLPRRLAATFFTALLDISNSPKLTSDPSARAAQSLHTVLHDHLPRILASTIRLIAGLCARSDIDVLAETLKKSIQKQPLLSSRLLKEALKEENGVLDEKAVGATKIEQRMRFAGQIEVLRGQGRKVNDLVKEFWIACKGREFQYVT